MEWTVTIEGSDEFGKIQRAQVRIEKGFERLASGEIGLSIDSGKRIMSSLQEFVVKQELATALSHWPRIGDFRADLPWRQAR